MGNEDSKDGLFEDENTPTESPENTSPAEERKPQKAESLKTSTKYPREKDNSLGTRTKESSKSPRSPKASSRSPRAKVSDEETEKEREERKLRREKEKEALTKFKEIFPQGHRHELLRFLRARNLNITNSTEMYKNYLKWVDEFKPSECDDKLFQNQLEKGKFYILTIEDKHPILYFIAKEHEADKDNYKDVLKYGCYVCELIIRNIQNSGKTQFIVFLNCSDTGWKHVDRKLLQAGIQVIQDCFPERLYQCYIYGLPPALVSIWSFVEKLLDERTRGKLILLKKSQFEDVFINKFPKELIPTELGGFNNNVPGISKELLIKMHIEKIRVELAEKIEPTLDEKKE